VKELAFIAVLLGNMTITSYRSVKEQTDNDPFITSTGEYVHSNGVALSRDLLYRWDGPVHYGDVVYMEGFGFKVVNDCMADWICLDRPRPKTKQNCLLRKYQRKQIDLWVKTYKEEKAVGVKKGKMWLVKTTLQKR